MSTIVDLFDTSVEAHDGIITLVDDVVFSDWLLAEMNDRDWSQAELARAARMSPQAISNYVRGTRKPDNEALAKIAAALGYSRERAMRAAGVLPELTDVERSELERWRWRVMGMTPAMRNLVLKIIDSVLAWQADQDVNEIIADHLQDIGAKKIK